MERKIQPVTKNINGLIVSAGFASRMGSFKPLMLFERKPFIIQILYKLHKVCDVVCVVTGYKHAELVSAVKNYLANEPELPDTEAKKISEKTAFIYNDYYETGMFSSLQRGVSYLEKSEWILYHFVDQPMLPEEFYFDFSANISTQFDWIQPSYKKLKGHPILFRDIISKSILDESKNSNLKTVSNYQHIRKYYWECHYPQIRMDIDTKDDYYKIIDLNKD